MGNLVDLARKLRPFIEKAALSLSDADALEAIQLFPYWDNETEYHVDDKVQYGGILYKCLQDHVAQAAWTPVAATSLWTKVLIPDPTVVPEWEQPDSTNPYQIGDKVMYNGKIYECIIANNVWAPDVYGWQEVSNT